jgi:putative Mn2+ efflux pump MntP
MQLIYLFFIAFINSVDNIGIGVAYSIAGARVQLRKNLLISFMAFIVSFVASLFGDVISHYLGEDIAKLISMLLLAFMGLRMIYEAYHKSREEEILNNIKIVSYKEAFSVGLALAIDDVPSSISSGLIGYGAFMVSMPYFVISFLIFFLGNYGTKLFSKLNIGKKANIIAGLILISIALIEFFE